MITKEEPVRKERSSFPIKAIVYYVLYCAFVQGMQTSARGLALGKFASQLTVVALRFQVAFIVVAILAMGVAVRERSWAVFKPGNVKAQAGRALAQAGQSGFVILAATQLGGGFQAAASLVTVPLWVVMLGRFAKKERPKWTVWFGVLAYLLVALLLMSQASIGEGTSMGLGVVYLLGSGFCTAALQVLTKKTANEHPLTATFWQNGPAALFCLPLWWYGSSPARLPAESVGWLLVGVLVACSLIQQVALLWANRDAKGASNEQLTGLRGVQIWFGTALDFLCFGVIPTGVTLLSIPMVGAAIKVLWETGRPKEKVAS